MREKDEKRCRVKRGWALALLTMLLTMTIAVWLPVRASAEGAQPQCNLQPWNTFYKYEYAYRTGDTSGLDAEDMDFYEGLKGYLDYAYQFDTPYEQEKAIHDYMVLNCEYAEDLLIDGLATQDVFYYDGVFVHKRAVCQGYALSFKLCMDILGIESRVVRGTVPDGKHAWNAVQLDGEWYWVDVTWDDPIPDVEGRVFYHYFNVPRWVMDIEHTTATTFDVEGTKYFGDEVLTLTVGAEQPELNQMLARHFWDLSRHKVLRVYLEKEDGSAWTAEEVQAYQIPISRMYGSAYNVHRAYSLENGSALCYYFQGWGTTAEVLLEYLITIGVFAGAIALVVIVVRKIRMRKKRKKLEAAEPIGDKDTAEGM